MNVAGNEFVDLSSLVLVGTLKNDNLTSTLDLVDCGIHGLISRFTAYASGNKSEDILHYGRTSDMFLRMMPEDVRRNMAAASGIGAVGGGPNGNDFDPGTIGGGASVRFTHKPIISGVCNSGKACLCSSSGLVGWYWSGSWLARRTASRRPRAFRKRSTLRMSAYRPQSSI